MDRKRCSCWMAALLAVALGVMGTAGGAADLFVDTNYYVIPMGTIEVDLATLIDTARGEGYTVILRSADVLEAYRGNTETTLDESELLNDRPLLYVDCGELLVLLSEPDYDLTLRPSAEGYDLLISPNSAILIGSTFGSALTQLYTLGIVGSSVGAGTPQAYEKQPLKGPAPPAGVPLESDLYGLVVAESWFDYAALHGMTRDGLRVEVVAEKHPGAILPADFRDFLVEETELLARLRVPIHRVVELASCGAFRLVRTAYEPQPATG